MNFIRLCACCNEPHLRFLTVDHINGGGNKQRKTIGQGRLYQWLIKNNFPDGYQILCFNCNAGREYNGGICPHEEDRKLV